MRKISENLNELFNDLALIDKIKKRLPHLFYLAELESSRAGKIGMQVGSLRENIIVALLIFKYGEDNIKTDIPITEAEVDVLLSGYRVSIKTISDKRLSGVKLIWTVDPHKANEFLENYFPYCDMLFIHIVWGGIGGFYHIPLQVQENVFKQIGRENYIKLPKPGTNPRGVEITKEALLMLVNDNMSKYIEITWQKPDIDYNPYRRWVDYWSEEQL